MKIKRIVDGKEIEIELTKEELQEATREHFALQNEEFIRSVVYEAENFDFMSDEEKEEMIRVVARQMVDYITIEGDDLDLFFELAEEYRKENGFEEEDFDDECEDEDVFEEEKE